ncbi:NAD(P)H-dependent oxidoreductase [Nocardiopsis exhalans]|uniref:FMN dependent NADH:quinone oxidoreductase n=1 Tax=Nocardiopsis exhalans TaxID=163604 RepID=A0ABY5DGD5_9ACTN|nr:NAD(P)H-dependent oxidoreductase [Nocardiopsis exhalans]USY23429.1 NAD(P)H-dependent oxidoreductase [Nocardiopsis exhalans]
MRSRSVTAAFRKAWQDQHPDGSVIYRDLAADPVPHLDAVTASTSYTDPADHTPAQVEAYAPRLELIKELEYADAVLIGAPMYNLTIPSTLKAWVDQVTIVGRTAFVEDSPIKGTPVFVVASRGGAYGPGTPCKGYECVQNYLQAVLADLVGMEIDFIVPELTTAHSNPALPLLIPLADAPKAKAYEDAISKGKAAAPNVAA